LGAVSYAQDQYLGWKHLAANNGMTQTIGLRETRMPFQDRELVEFVTSIPDEQLLKPGFRRSLVRRALAGTVPAEVFSRRQKAVCVRGPMSALERYMSTLAGMRGRFEVARLSFADSDRLWTALSQAASTRSDNLVGIIRMLGVEHWLRDSAVRLAGTGCTLAHDAAAHPAPAKRDFCSAAQVG